MDIERYSCTTIFAPNVLKQKNSIK